MRTQATGAAPASASARTRPPPGRRGKPFTLNVSSSNPAAGTSRASIRSGVPAKLTATPRASSASATASAGRTCPAVPPAAIRHLSFLSLAIHGDVKEDADGGEPDDETRAAVAHERQRDSRQRQEAEHGTHVDGGLAADEGCEPGREELSEGLAAAQRDVEAGVTEERERSDHADRAEQAELLADDREDHVCRRLRQVVDLLDAFPEPDPEKASRPERDHRLHRLEARAVRVLPGIEEAEKARAPVRLEPDGGQQDRYSDASSAGQHARWRAGDDQHRRHHDGDRDRGS